MREEYNSVLSTPTEADKTGYFGRYRYTGETKIPAISSFNTLYHAMNEFDSFYA